MNRRLDLMVQSFNNILDITIYENDVLNSHILFKDQYSNLSVDVDSDSVPNLRYTVNINIYNSNNVDINCTCMGFKNRKNCKHLYGVLIGTLLSDIKDEELLNSMIQKLSINDIKESHLNTTYIKYDSDVSTEIYYSDSGSGSGSETPYSQQETEVLSCSSDPESDESDFE